MVEVKPSFPRDSPQFQIVPELAPRSSEAVFDKIAMSAFVGTALIWFGLYLKARLEERFLGEELGPAYDDYARRVPMLVPRARSSPPST